MQFPWHPGSYNGYEIVGRLAPKNSLKKQVDVHLNLPLLRLYPKEELAEFIIIGKTQYGCFLVLMFILQNEDGVVFWQGMVHIKISNQVELLETNWKMISLG